MDKTKEYIKMCDCPEIQESKGWGKDGNYYSWKVIEPGKIAIDEYPGGINTSIWLPRQDQIQEMVKTNILDLLNKFYKYVFDDLSWMFNKDHTIKFRSMEQLWLAFYMYEKYSKVWNGEKWLKK